MPTAPQPPMQRFLAKVAFNPDTGCEEWQAAANRQGYGCFGVGHDKLYLAHRWRYEQVHGPLPRGAVVRHTCDNPRCVTLEHLVAGSQADNMRDMQDRGRSKKGRLSSRCKRGHDMSDAYVHTRSDGRVARTCRTCKRMRQTKAWRSDPARG